MAETPDIDPRTARQLRALEELGEIGLDVARALRRQAIAVAEATDEPMGEAAVGEAAVDRPAVSRSAAARFGGDLALAFSRVSRAIRQTLALEHRLAEGERLAAVEHAAAERRRAFIAGLMAPSPRQAAVRAAVERVIAAGTLSDPDGGEQRAERLLDDLDEWLDEADGDEDFEARPLAEVVAEICADIGAPFDPAVWAARLQAEDGTEDQTEEYGTEEDETGEDETKEDGDETEAEAPPLRARAPP